MVVVFFVDIVVVVFIIVVVVVVVVGIVVGVASLSPRDNAVNICKWRQML